ncbi:hypothetical protein [Krasilnikoviella flava]|uniref:Heavy metal transporter n=1 Tax=Krasilnikoviella flava TaxID=526729 RepID=A0A1T5JM83_9MICO|nr:hypothetical protein [Krasilnikoviella flava]SKC52494.1 hypothetical protein SAMN04324258_1543 [Krasilnikoviella flava]
MSGRRRRRRATGAALAAVLVVGAGATAGVVWFLDRVDTPSVQRCAAELDGTSWYLTPDQAQNAALVVGTTVQRGLPGRAATIGLATALQESRLINIDYGDRDSVGLFQQRPSQGWGTVDEIMDPVYSTGKFYDGLVEVEGYEELEVTVAAQAVQRSAFPEAYAQHETRSRAWASALTGHSPGAITCELPPSESEAAPAGSTARDVLVERAARDLGLPGDALRADAGDEATNAVVVDATALPLAGELATWAVAHWAVATASVTGAEEVRAGARTWSREHGTWSVVDDDADRRPEGQVAIVLQ